MTEQEADLWDRASFGKQVEAFWDSQVGNYLHARIKLCYSDAIAELKSVDPTDMRAVMKAQNKVALAEQINTWVSEAILDGLKSLDLLEGEGDAE